MRAVRARDLYPYAIRLPALYNAHKKTRSYERACYGVAYRLPASLYHAGACLHDNACSTVISLTRSPANILRMVDSYSGVLSTSIDTRMISSLHSVHCIDVMPLTGVLYMRIAVYVFNIILTP